MVVRHIKIKYQIAGIVYMVLLSLYMYYFSLIFSFRCPFGELAGGGGYSSLTRIYAQADE